MHLWICSLPVLVLVVYLDASTLDLLSYNVKVFAQSEFHSFAFADTWYDVCAGLD